MIQTPVRTHVRPFLLPLLIGATAMVGITQAHAADSAAMAADTATTKLRLSATGTVHAPPDELTAVFFAEASAPTAAAAQGQVNAQVDKAMGIAHGVAGLTVNAESYTVHHQEADPRISHPSQWIARQSIRISATDGTILLPLLGRIQSDNLALSRLDWSLSRAHRTALVQQAEGLALHELQQRAQAAATALGLKIARIESVNLNDQDMPSPMPMMMAARAASMSAPQAPAADQDVTAQADATFILHP
ncbi:SIMPL domain-containing protein [Gluconacetobacter entanii]|uniref:SIMPL domain-containing protein n=1 Tax=Gluconacetobacter entanii TaxID=108528 RepID=A0ABT3K8G9_9PROT|nr:SIMPL domain-containing protein [Gluconacetobacter entanii]MCW4591396.1 SIMPL domain-containing protein [Gluconacetobacter entanii]MCW4594938.1 SIMPL domain-containing protein [Gluconacetobacter entanii]NPC88348.1 SIMPL domain-containing protein [Gluconacetobacter entanii]